MNKNSTYQPTPEFVSEFKKFYDDLVQQGCPAECLDEFQNEEIGVVLDRFEGSGDDWEDEIVSGIERLGNEFGYEVYEYVPFPKGFESATDFYEGLAVVVKASKKVMQGL